MRRLLSGGISTGDRDGDARRRLLQRAKQFNIGEGLSLTEREKAILAANAADEKQAENVVILDMASLTVMTDYFVICSGTSNVQVRAITTGIREQMAEAGLRPVRSEGDHNSRWVLMDYGGVVIHVFHHSEREFYDLERLWDEAPRVQWAEAASPAKS